MQHWVGHVRKPMQTCAGPATSWRPRLAGAMVQARLRVGEPGDAFEHEANQVASRLARGESEQVRPQLRVTDVQRMCTDCDEEQALAQRSTREASGVTTSMRGRADDAMQQVIASPGAPLPAADRQWFGNRLGADLSSVRVHSDSAAARSADELDARAYTTGAHIVFGRGEYAPHTPSGRFLLAHELAHTVQQGATPRAVQRWAIGTALPAGAPPSWQLVPADHLPRLALAEADIRSVLGSRTCRSYFEGNCTGRTAASLQNAFDNAVIFHRNTNDDTFGGQLGTSPNISYNTTAHRIGHWFMASTLLHETFHSCDTNFDAGDERAAENAIESCHLHTPFILGRFPASGPAGTRVTLSGVSFGSRQGAFDAVELNGTPVPVIAWGFAGGAGSSAQRIVVEIPDGATSGDLVVINNNVRSNPRSFTVV